jgi:hypothetical protein
MKEKGRKKKDKGKTEVKGQRNAKRAKRKKRAKGKYLCIAGAGKTLFPAGSRSG